MLGPFIRIVSDLFTCLWCQHLWMMKVFITVGMVTRSHEPVNHSSIGEHIYCSLPDAIVKVDLLDLQLYTSSHSTFLY